MLNQMLSIEEFNGIVRVRFGCFLRCVCFHTGLVFRVMCQKSITLEYTRSLLVRFGGGDCATTIVSGMELSSGRPTHVPGDMHVELFEYDALCAFIPSWSNV